MCQSLALGSQFRHRKIIIFNKMIKIEHIYTNVTRDNLHLKLFLFLYFILILVKMLLLLYTLFL